jgi:hypothetical protein
MNGRTNRQKSNEINTKRDNVREKGVSDNKIKTKMINSRVRKKRIPT